jgi:hypothetical protein
VRLIIAILLFSPILQAKPHPMRYIQSHKELIASDAIIFAALSADAASSVHCQSISVSCAEQNPFLNRRPSIPATWSFAMGYAGSVIAADHALWHITRNDKFTSHLIWLSSLPIGVIETLNVKSNVNTAEGLQNARNRLTIH